MFSPRDIQTIIEFAKQKNLDTVPTAEQKGAQDDPLSLDLIAVIEQYDNQLNLDAIAARPEYEYLSSEDHNIQEADSKDEIDVEIVRYERNLLFQYVGTVQPNFLPYQNLLQQAEDHGLTEHHLQELVGPNEDVKTISSAQTEILFDFIVNKNLTPEAAIQEIKNINHPELLRILRNFYDKGLRGEDLRSWKPREGKELLFSRVLKKLVEEEGVEVREAIRQLSGLESDKLNLLNEFYAKGLRKELIENIEYLNEQQICEEVCNFLQESKLTSAEVTEELKSLNKNQALSLFAFYKDGLRGEQLRKWQAPNSDNNYSVDHNYALDFLIKEQKLNPAEAIQQINKLTDLFAFLVVKYYEKGLRGEHLRNWQPAENENWSSLHRAALGYLIDELNVSPPEALQRLNKKTQAEAYELMLPPRARPGVAK